MDHDAPLFDSRRQENYSASKSVVQGITWSILMRWAMRFIGLISTLILARLLSPEDFGIVAMGMVIVHFLFEFSELGVSTHLIRSQEIDRNRCDTAWSINILQALLTAFLLILLAVPASIYFKEPRVVEVMAFLALATFIGGFENIGPTLMRRDLRFAKDFNFNVWKKVLVFLATVISAVIFRNYWALLIGQLTGKVAGVVLSYVMHSYRPRWSLSHAREYVTFGLTMVPLRVAITLRGSLSSFLVAGLGNATVLGAYRLAGDLSSIFTREIVMPMGRGLLPNYSRLANDKAELSNVYRKMLGLVALICIPIGLGIATVANDFVLILLGPQWGMAAKLMQYLAIGAAIQAISQAMVGQILVAIGRERPAAVLAWIRLIITAPILWAGFQLGGVTGLAAAGIVSGIACLPVIYNEMRRAVDLPISALVGLLWRPIIASAVMVAVIRALPTENLEWAMVRLLVDVGVGGVAFVSATGVLWVASGLPKSAEKIVFDLLLQGASRLRARLS